MKRVTLFLAALAVALLPTIARADVATADATAYMGAWALTFDGPMGPIDFVVTFSDDGGKLAAKIEGTGFGAGPVSSITKGDDGITLAFELDAAGMVIPSKLTVNPSGAEAKGNLDIMDGMFSAPGSGKKK
jgi:opacity protein-like surface antigen